MYRYTKKTFPRIFLKIKLFVETLKWQALQNAFFLIKTEAEDSPGIDFDENQYDLKKKIYGTIIKIIINK